MTPDDAPSTIAALAGTVAALGTRLGIMQGQVEAAATREALEALAARHEELASLVAEVLEAETPKGPAAIDWTRLDPEARSAALAALSLWVNDVLLPGYPNCGLRDCWASHRQAVIELSNIWQAWRHAYQRRRPDLKLALEWHDRWMPNAMRRIEFATRNCVTHCTARRR